jgi:hypothetical protein
MHRKEGKIVFFTDAVLSETVSSSRQAEIGRAHV